MDEKDIAYCNLTKQMNQIESKFRIFEIKTMPDGTMYFSNGSFFQDFSGFQKQNFQVHFQQANNVSHPQEQIFSTSFLEPASQQDLL